MATAEFDVSAPVKSAYHGQIDAAIRRFGARAAQREETLRTLERRGVLHTDTPERVTKRLVRLGVDWSLATAMEHTPARTTRGRSLGEALEPNRFGADVLGLERLMGRNDLIPVSFLEAGHLASRSVGRITVRGEDPHLGTGFMVSPTLLLTNNHVLRTAEEAALGFVEFNVQAGLNGRALAPVAFSFEPERFFATDAALDFTLVAVAPRSEEGAALAAFGWLPLSEAQGKVILGEFVNIIQHPQGEPKQLAVRENQVVDVLDDFLHHLADTGPGSSGSAVFNDQWEVVALHHAGVPATDDAGQLLAVDGSPWRPEMGEQKLAWQANEAVRISRVLKKLRGMPLTGEAATLREELFACSAPAAAGPPPAPSLVAADGVPGVSAVPGVPGVSGVPAGPAAPVAPVVPAAAPAAPIAHAAPPRADGVPAPVAAPPAAPPPPPPPPSMPVAAVVADREAALVNVEAARERPYLDRAGDRAAQEAYYAGVDTSGGAALRRTLTELLETTHVRRPAYRPMRLLYPWVDLHPDRRLRSIYSGRTFSAEEMIEADAAVAAARVERMQELLVREGEPGPARFAAELAALEAALPFNCEHVVPQSWFGEDEPMRGDLHHLFTCESGCNSFRGNFPYVDFPDFGEAVRTACGRRERDGFEPAAGKGPIARATLYFLLRYPGFVGDARGELPRERLELLLSWHESEPVGDYERHRNFAIGEIQGNRNPLIDHPEWARQIDFTDVWAGTARRPG